MNKLISGLLLSGALLIGAALPTIAHAADTTAAESRSGQTTVSAGFEANTSTVDPVDPTDPNNPGDGGDNGATPGGGLSLIYVTSKLNFGTHEIDVLKSNSYAANDSTSDTSALWGSKAVIEVSDVRGTNAGWSLGVTGGTLTETGSDGKVVSGGDTIDGATLALPSGTVTASGATSDNGAVSTPATNVLNTSSTVLSASDGNGSGVTVDQLDPSAIQLTVPANSAEAKTYSTTLNWTLTSSADE